MISLGLAVAVLGPQAAFAAEGSTTALEPISKARFKVGGEVGRRIQVGVDQWLIPAPASNPGMLGMFQVRDRQPPPQVVPWAGEFAGKYLISAVQTLRLSDDPRLEATVKAFVARLIDSQDADGYLGPFPRKERLLGQWDLWGHYHVMLGLLLWHDRTGDPRALEACRKMASLIEKTYPDAKRSFYDAGSHEMNMAIAHGLGRLYLVSPDPKLLTAIKAVETDWQRAGDYFNAGLAGIDFFRSPRPRWESFHDLQALVSTYQITRDQRYSASFLNLWRSIRRTDRHNTGSFSTGEQACGDPYEPGAIETCCSVAWTAITLDALRLTGDSVCADELELSMHNAILGAQHPSGRWCTYSTPMEGTREASPHAIVFQARAGTPELNCCSVNGPRGLGILSEWAVMRGPGGTIVVNDLEAMKISLPLADGTSITLENRTRYPLDGDVALVVGVPKPITFSLWVRVPGFVHRATLDVPGAATLTIERSGYIKLHRKWQPGDVVHLRFDLPLRAEPGDRATAGKASIYRGPLLLAFDPRFNAFDAEAMPVLKPADLAAARVTFPTQDPAAEAVGVFSPQLIVDVPSTGGKVVRLCDYASAGSSGTPYRTWLAMSDLPPSPPLPTAPDDGAAVAPGAFLVKWRPSPLSATTTYRFVVGDTSPEHPIFTVEQKGGERMVVPSHRAGLLRAGPTYYWMLTATNDHGTTSSLGPARRLTIAPALPRAGELSEADEANPDALLIADSLAGAAAPRPGKLESSLGTRPAEGPGKKPNTAVETDGRKGKVIYCVSSFPDWDFSVAVRFQVTAMPTHMAQVVSSWTRYADDPIRIVIDKGRLFARIEPGGSTEPGLPVEPGRWMHVAAVKQGGHLTFFADGKSVATLPAAGGVSTASRAIALGGNPRHTGDEHLAARFADLRFYARALDAGEVARLARGE